MVITAPELKQKLRQLEIIAESSRALNASLDYDRLIGVIMRIVRKALKAEAVSLAIMDVDNRHLVIEVARGRRDKNTRGSKIPVGEGVMGWVGKSGRPYVVDDVRTDKRYSRKLEKQLGRPQTILAVPLKRGDDVIGVLEGVNRRDGEPFSKDDLELAEVLGEHIATAITNAQLYRRAQRVGLEYSMLSDVGADIGKSIALDEVLSRIIKNLGKLIRFDAAAIFVVDRNGEQVESMLHQGYPRGTDERINVKSHEGIVGIAADKREGLIVDDVRENPSYISVRKSTRSEMVAPMLSRGRLIGMFNLESDRVGAYTEHDLRLLEAFAAQAGVAIERAQLYEEQREKEEIQKELRVARTVQEFFTPRKARVAGGYRIAGVNFPSLEVSGDYYDFFPIKNGLLAFAIADVAGKGVPASLIMASFRASLHTLAPYLSSARQIALRANRILLETARPQDFVTAFIGVLNPSTGEVTYCNAGHNPPVLMSPAGQCRLLETGGPILGVFEDIPLQEGRLKLTDEVLLCYTDGATEARNAADDEYGEDGVIDALGDSFDLSPSRICRAMFARLKEYTDGAPQSDDVTYLVLKHR